jgi:peptidoglycan/LPS O-acetylase OafA/YrhL
LSANSNHNRVFQNFDLKGYRSSDHLDALRAIASLAVLVSHVRGLFFIDHAQLTQTNVLWKFFYFATSLGHNAVIVFFVLSGFLIAGKVVQMLIKKQWSWTRYLVDRIVRLQIVLIPALILCALIDTVAASYFGPNSIYGGQSLGSVIVDFRAVERDSVEIFVGNVLFLQHIIVPTFGSDSPLWSLSYEFWYYMLFPAAALILWRSTMLLRMRLFYAAVAVLIAVFIGDRLRWYFLIWMMGAALLLVPMMDDGISRRIWKILKVGLCLAALPISLVCIQLLKGGLLDRSIADVAAGLACAVFIYALLQDRRVRQSDTYSRVCRFFSRFSYTLYLTHMPLLFLLRQCLLTDHRWYPDFVHLLMGVLIVIAALTYAYVISLFTERKTNACKHRLMQLLETFKLNPSVNR